MFADDCLESWDERAHTFSDWVLHHQALKTSLHFDVVTLLDPGDRDGQVEHEDDLALICCQAAS